MGKTLLLNRYTGTFGTIALIVLMWNLYIDRHDDGILVGSVVGDDGVPVEGAEVVLAERTVVSLTPIGKTTTDANGAFRFERHNRHALVLTAAKDGISKAGRTEVRLYFRIQIRELTAPLVLLR